MITRNAFNLRNETGMFDMILLVATEIEVPFHRHNIYPIQMESTPKGSCRRDNPVRRSGPTAIRIW
jgi:hypothetical protein